MEAKVCMADVCLPGKKLHVDNEDEVDVVMGPMCRRTWRRK